MHDAVRCLDSRVADDEDPKIDFPHVDAYREWVAAEREAYTENRIRLERDGEITPPRWDLHLEVMSFSYLERAFALELERQDPSGESIERYNQALDNLLGDLERFRLTADDVNPAE
jgi:hypothetical protein